MRVSKQVVRRVAIAVAVSTVASVGVMLAVLLPADSATPTAAQQLQAVEQSNPMVSAIPYSELETYITEATAPDAPQVANWFALRDQVAKLFSPGGAGTRGETLDDILYLAQGLTGRWGTMTTTTVNPPAAAARGGRRHHGPLARSAGDWQEVGYTNTINYNYDAFFAQAGLGGITCYPAIECQFISSVGSWTLNEGPGPHFQGYCTDGAWNGHGGEGFYNGGNSNWVHGMAVLNVGINVYNQGCVFNQQKNAAIREAVSPGSWQPYHDCWNDWGWSGEYGCGVIQVNYGPFARDVFRK